MKLILDLHPKAEFLGYLLHTLILTNVKIPPESLHQCVLAFLDTESCALISLPMVDIIQSLNFASP